MKRRWTRLFKVEVKGAEDHYAWGTIQHAVGEEPAVWLSRARKEVQSIVLEDWRRPQGRVRTFNGCIASTDETAMAAATARIVMAVGMWLRIVGAERSGRTAVSHRHGLFVDIYFRR